MEAAAAGYQDRDFWKRENLTYSRPHFRLDKCARLVNRLSHGKHCDLLDVGCGPAALMRLLRSTICYHGIDIAIHEPSPNLLEVNFATQPIAFNGKKFDIIVAQGVFEYLGGLQEQKLMEISNLLTEDGLFVASYVNFNHRNRNIYWLYNNIQPFASFYGSLSKVFHVVRYFPTSHRWRHDEPRDRVMWALQRYININIPILSRMFGVEYLFVCSRKG